MGRNTNLAGVAAVFLIASAIPWIFAAQAQTETTFKPTDVFGIPARNGTISFATGGTYTRASLVNDTWNFVDLRLNYSGPPENLSASTRDSNVTIMSYETFNVTSGNEARLRYVVAGNGEQIFNLQLNTKGGDWSVAFNSTFLSENDKWRVSPDQTLTITGATSNVNVTLYYFDLSGLGSNSDSSNQPFYQQHSVAIATAVIVVAAVVSTAMIRRRNQTRQGRNLVQTSYMKIPASEPGFRIYLLSPLRLTPVMHGGTAFAEEQAKSSSAQIIGYTRIN